MCVCVHAKQRVIASLATECDVVGKAGVQTGKTESAAI